MISRDTNGVSPSSIRLMLSASLAHEENPPVFLRVFALGDGPGAAKVHGIQAQEPEAQGRCAQQWKP